jgi:hypothetical protein
VKGQLAVGVAVAAAVAAAWVPGQVAGTGSEVALVAKGTSTTEATYWLDLPGTLKLNERAQANPGEFAGVSMDQASGTVTVRYAAGSKAAARERLAGTAAATPAGNGSMPVKFVPAKYSLKELQEVADGITADRSWLPGADKLSKWYVDVDANAVTVGLTEVTAAATEAAERTFGDRVRLVVAERASEASSRLDDIAPWAGGERIEISGDLCTAGFAIERSDNSGEQEMITAGHCGAIGDVVHNRDNNIGTIVQDKFLHGGLDVAYIGEQHYAPFIYMGNASSDVGRRVRGTRSLVKGLGICTDGAFTGQNCAGIVTQTDLCVTVEGKDSCHVAEASSRDTDGSILVQHGDSGGPVVELSGADGVLVLGMITYTTDNGTRVGFHPVSAIVPAGWRVSTG